MITISLDKLKPKMCPICGKTIPNAYPSVDITLNDGTVMPQPVCSDPCLALMKIKAYQDAMVTACIAFWNNEIDKSTTMTDKMKTSEKTRINKLTVK